MQRKIFYQRRSRRPLAILLGLASMGAVVFSVGVYTGSAYPDLFTFGPTAPAAQVAAAGF
ncbi:MAG TPA: hypothetical protein PKA57_04980 [Parvibaculum sp.]|uniref:hypothetical protein n=1 Tax=Parvibaculum sp. TaxID=2024848 RepID=UPI002C3864B9|nr:hypothetical protein [Parvibaculum sp.]HMM13960.1 hypothetical protein [Parvibaculum sp.]